MNGVFKFVQIIKNSLFDAIEDHTYVSGIQPRREVFNIIFRTTYSERCA